MKGREDYVAFKPDEYSFRYIRDRISTVINQISCGFAHTNAM